ncbi:SMC family ATPase [Paenibacillus sp. KACC 21273]|uniref:SbcC/MukB-like Walker B domain-containing protein n=1 Tax=Paenibacillus sp. KACC 21273 TaxID=3025665 RepID=UPI0023671816|nr:SMC family ATPase [Paenibacillus sp. KACC 21273]WDF52231.1 SMC family ATPase [Paenibacillus sp. KACC 21273]
MKPITLKLSGLQSYREQQEIDFEALCETGLFGIFGPTGSGKSTVLDAITLALYGKVERAYNGTQGIMNHSEDSLFVSFSFELLSAEGAQRYRVERRFKRTGDHTVSNAMSRFIEMREDGDVVVADKLADVTRCVEDYIGLKMDDFTRAVVLPQGKFAEFLSLKGSDRRQMLQRLFHLERYGDRLMQKLSQRVKETDNVLGKLYAEQTGLGEASAEALQTAIERLETAIQEAEQRRQELADMTARTEQWGKIREYQQEQARLQQRLDQLQQHEADIVSKEKQIEQAISAQNLLPLLDTWRTHETKAIQEQQRVTVLQQQLEQADRAVLVAAEHEQQAKQQLTEQEPSLLKRIEQLQQALQLQKECAALEQDQQQIQNQLEATQKQLEEASHQVQREQMLLDKARQRQEELNKQLKACEVRSQDRRELQEAQQQLSALDTARTRLQEQQTEYDGYHQSAQQANQAWQQITEQEAQRSVQEQQLQQQIFALYQDHQQLANDLQITEQSVEQLEEQHAQQAKEEESNRLAMMLAAELQEGEPCSVCGSIHHPQPAHISNHLSALADESVSTTQGSENIDQQTQTLKQIKQHLQMQQQQVRGRQIELDSNMQEWDWQLDNEESVSVPNDQASVLSEIELQAQFANLQAQNQHLEQQTRALQQQLRQWRQDEREWSGRRLTAQSEQQSSGRLVEQSHTRLQAATQSLEQLLQQWQQKLPHLTEQSARERFAALAQMDEQAEKIREGLEKSVPYIEEREQAIKNGYDHINTLDKQRIQDQTRQEGNQQLLQEKKNRLTEWIGDQSAQHLLTDTQQQQQQLRQQAEQTTDLWRTALQHQQTATHQVELAVQSLQSLQEQVNQHAEKWQQALQASPFDNEQSVSQSRMTEEQIQADRQQIQSHREQQHELSVHLREVQHKLNGQSVSEEEWAQIQQQYTAARQADESALEQRAKATRDREDLEQRHVRWRELENQRVTLAQEAKHLSKLQASMRGNAFVEYIAEEQLMQVSLAASERLRFLTKQRYSLEVDSGGGFVICDNGNGGIRRPVSSLSGGETFLTSLSLALALSAQIQLRGQYPLQFFFLDEGFGTLDPELLDTVVTSLEKLHNDQLSVGIISHVPELRMRLPRKLVIVPAEQAGSGSKVMLERM